LRKLRNSKPEEALFAIIAPEKSPHLLASARQLCRCFYTERVLQGVSVVGRIVQDSQLDQAGSVPVARPVSGRWNKLKAQLRSLLGRAIGDYNMIADGDRIMVCLSGGKDSYTLLDLLTSLQRRAPVKFELIAVNLDQKQPGFPEDVLPRYLDSLKVDYRIVQEDTYSIVTRVVAPGKTMCGLCSRLRRGILYRVASELGATKIALGHHRDDIVETFFLNMFYGGKLKAMPPKLVSDDGRHTIIRPLAYCSEREIERYASQREFPIIPCNLCGSQAGLKRQQIKAMLAEWEREDPGRTVRLFRSLQHVSPSHLADRALFDFEGLSSVPNQTA
jgi:tRNA 2-thiocytidine biosynthesis protein TtcA